MFTGSRTLRLLARSILVAMPAERNGLMVLTFGYLKNNDACFQSLV